MKNDESPPRDLKALKSQEKTVTYSSCGVVRQHGVDFGVENHLRDMRVEAARLGGVVVVAGNEPGRNGFLKGSFSERGRCRGKVREGGWLEGARESRGFGSPRE